MRRTSSGNDLAGSKLFDASTPYVYMAAVESEGDVISPSTVKLVGAQDLSFQRHCGGATVRALGGGGSASFALPSGFMVELRDNLLIATELGPGGEGIFSLPLGCVSRVSLLRASGANLHLWSLLCGCCFGEREQVLALDIDAPVGWLQWSRCPSGVAGPVRLGLYVRDSDDWIDAMGVRDLLD